MQSKQPGDSPQVSRVIAAGIIGNVLEWYDFAIYGYFAAAIGKHFFPHEDAVAQLLAAFGVFALGYLMRPVGGALIGHIGDRFGRRAPLTFSVAAMAIPTFLIGLLPGYATLGIMAPIALTLLRMVQGLSVGGEYTSSMVFLVEHAPDGRRGLMGALASSGASGGILLGSAVGAGFAASMSDATLDAWGWRIPFLLGLVVGIAGYFLRRHVLDTAPAERRKRAPIIETLHDHWRIVLGFTGLLTDRIGRKPVLLLACILGFVGALPVFLLLNHPSALLAQLGQLGLVVMIGLYGGAQPTIMVETAPLPVRCTAVALGYNISLGVIGGSTPLVATWLVNRTGDEIAPAFMVMAAAAVTFATLLWFRETYRTPFIGGRSGAAAAYA